MNFNLRNVSRLMSRYTNIDCPWLVKQRFGELFSISNYLLLYIFINSFSLFWPVF